MGRLDKKIALVTGGSSGIGQAIALAFAGEGADVCITGRNMARANAVAEEIEKSGHRALAIKADLAKLPDIDKMVSSAINQFGRIDILVNNAGGGP